MVGRRWDLACGERRSGEAEDFLRQSALPLVEGQMGCAAVYALREPETGHFVLLAFWVSRKAMRVASESREWGELASRLSDFGVTLRWEEGRAYETIASFLAGEKPEAPSAPR